MFLRSCLQAKPTSEKMAAAWETGETWEAAEEEAREEDPCVDPNSKDSQGFRGLC